MDLEAPLRALAAFARRRSFRRPPWRSTSASPLFSVTSPNLEREAAVKLVVRRL
jgi:hypothetical protein